MLLKFARKDQAAAPADALAPPLAADQRAVIRDLAARASEMGREAAELYGTLEDLHRIGAEQAHAFAQLLEEARRMGEANLAIARAADAGRAAATRARGAVERVATDVGAVLESLREVAQAAGDITRIALQTRLVAFNASVEAKRAGEAGRGFAVVAEAVKDLAQKVEATSQQIASTVRQLDVRIGELARNIRASEAQGGQETFHRAFAHVEGEVAAIAARAAKNEEGCNTTLCALERLAQQVQETARALESSKKRAEHFLTASEQLLELTADCGAETDDTPFITAVIEAANEISRRFERALDEGRISEADLFDENYVPIPGTNPQQFMTRFTAFTDQVLPDIQERMLALSDKVVFCAAVDRNGYLPTHNRKFSLPQGRDPVWNAAHCRNRRIFNDRTGLAAGRNTRRFLLQTYRRDMGGGRFVLMKDLSAPIFVRGRHWGGLRLAYQF